MALTVVKNLTDISACENTTNWSGTPTAGTTLVREGTNALGAQVSQTTSNFIFTTASLNLTNQRVYIWASVAGLLDTKANGGIGILIGDTTNQRAYYVGGSDDLGFQVGVWSCYVLDCANLPSNFTQVLGAAGPTVSAVTRIGIRFKVTSKAQGTALNCFWDMLRYGTGITVYGGDSSTPIAFSDIATDDASTAAGKAYGIIRKIQTGVYGIQGDIIFGDSSGTNTFYFKDSDAVVVIEDHVAGAGTPTDINLTVTSNATAATSHFELGVSVGSGDTQSGRNGVLFKNANLNQPVIFDASNANLKQLLIYGGGFTGLKKASTTNIKFSNDATNGPNHTLSGVVFDRSAQVDIGRVVTRECIFSGFNQSSNGILLWNSNINIKNCQFIADSTYAIEMPSAGTFTYDGLTFSGNTTDINNTSTATLDDNYSETNQDSSTTLNSGGVVAVGQSFTGNGGQVSRAKFYLKKTGSPTGNATAKIYTHSGTFGTSSIPTGTALATSDNFDVSTLTTSFALTGLKFTGSNTITLTNTTKYVVSIEYSGGDASNNIQVGYDGSSPTHGGNYSSETGTTWTAQSGRDTCFYVYTGGIVIINATDLANPSTSFSTGNGSTAINNAVTIAATVLDTLGSAIKNARVAIYASNNILAGQELLNALTDSNGQVSTSYNYTGNQSIVIRVRAETPVLSTPVNTTFTQGTGTLGAGTYYYRVSATNDIGETLASTETNLTITASHGVNVNWGSVTGATGYKVYGRTTGAEQLITSVGVVTTYLDNGSITPSGALPGSNTSGTTRYINIDASGTITASGYSATFTMVADTVASSSEL